jgi:hypothetical protein
MSMICNKCGCLIMEDTKDLCPECQKKNINNNLIFKDIYIFDYSKPTIAAHKANYQEIINYRLEINSREKELCIGNRDSSYNYILIIELLSNSKVSSFFIQEPLNKNLSYGVFIDKYITNIKKDSYIPMEYLNKNSLKSKIIKLNTSEYNEALQWNIYCSYKEISEFLGGDPNGYLLSEGATFFIDWILNPDGGLVVNNIAVRFSDWILKRKSDSSYVVYPDTSFNKLIKFNNIDLIKVEPALKDMMEASKLDFSVNINSLSKIIGTNTIINVIKKLPYIESRIPYTYHHDFIINYFSFLSRSNVAFLKSWSYEDLYCGCLCFLVNEAHLIDAINLTKEDWIVIKYAKNHMNIVIEELKSYFKDR